MATSPTFFLLPQSGVSQACSLNVTHFDRWQQQCLAYIYDRVIMEIYPVRRIFDLVMMESEVNF